jgi:hypothetical protein
MGKRGKRFASKKGHGVPCRPKTKAMSPHDQLFHLQAVEIIKGCKEILQEGTLPADLVVVTVSRHDPEICRFMDSLTPGQESGPSGKGICQLEFFDRSVISALKKEFPDFADAFDRPKEDGDTIVISIYDRNNMKVFNFSVLTAEADLKKRDESPQAKAAFKAFRLFHEELQRGARQTMAKGYETKDILGLVLNYSVPESRKLARHMLLPNAGRQMSGFGGGIVVCKNNVAADLSSVVKMELLGYELSKPIEMQKVRVLVIVNDQPFCFGFDPMGGAAASNTDLSN